MGAICRRAPLALLLVGLGGCPKDRPAPGPASGGGPPPKAGSAAGIAAKGRGYTVAVRPTAGKAGAAVTTDVELAALPGFKINKEYPLRLIVEAPAGAAPRKLVMQKKDATVDKPSKLLLRPAFSLGGGKHPFSAEFRFAICTANDSQCWPVRESLKWVTEAKNR